MDKRINLSPNCISRIGRSKEAITVPIGAKLEWGRDDQPPQDLRHRSNAQACFARGVVVRIVLATGLQWLNCLVYGGEVVILATRHVIGLRQ